MITKVLVGTDTTVSADLAMTRAAELARAHDAELTILYVKPPQEVREVFDPSKRPDPGRYLAGIAGRLTGIRVRLGWNPVRIPPRRSARSPNRKGSTSSSLATVEPGRRSGGSSEA